MSTDGALVKAAKSTTRARVYGLALMCLVAFLWAVLEAMAGYVMRSQSPYEIVWARYGTHLCLMLIVLGPRYGTNLVRTSSVGMQVFRGLTMLGVSVFLIVSAKYMPAQDAWAIFWLSPMMVLILSLLLLGEHVSLHRWAAAIVGFVGVLLVLRPGAGIARWSAILALGAGVCFSLYQVTSRRMRAENIWVSLFYTGVSAFAPLCLVIKLAWHMPTLTSGLLMMGIGALGLGQLFALDRALEMAPASLLAPLVYTQVVWAVVLDYLLFGHALNASAIPGAVLIIGGGLVLFVRESRLAAGYNQPQMT